MRNYILTPKMLSSQALPGAGFGEITSSIGTAWKELPDSEKAHYQKLADEATRKAEDDFLAKKEAEGECESIIQ